MTQHFPPRLAAAALLAATLPFPAIAQEADSATRRRQARYEWYNESYGKPPADLRHGGPWPPEFRRFMMEAAERERRKWGALIPGGTGPRVAGGPNWTNIGPTRADYIQNGSFLLFVTDSGRVRNIVPHPANADILYVSFSSGGVWRTLDGGGSWTPLTDGLGSLSTGWLEMDPGNPNVLYLGLGDPFDGTGIGLVKSIDGGASWSAPVFLGSSVFITQVMVSPTDSNVVLAATNAGLFRSTDAGATFAIVPLATGGTGAPIAWSIAWTGGAGFVLAVEAAGAPQPGQVWTSSNNGASWRRAGRFDKPVAMNRITVASAPSRRHLLYAVASNTGGQLADFFQSTDAGQNWIPFRATAQGVQYQNAVPGAFAPAALFNTQGSYDQMLLVNPLDENAVFFGGALHNGRLRRDTPPLAPPRTTYWVATEWLGRFGLPYVHADAHAAAYDINGNLYFGGDGGIFKSTDGGATFTDTLNHGLVTHLIYNLGSSTSNPAAVIGGFQDNGTRVRAGATTTYNQIVGGDGFGCDVHAANAQYMLASLYNTRLYKSTNGGVSFNPACTGIPECGNTGSTPFLTRLVPWLGSPTGDVVFTATNTIVYKSSDYAGSWSALGTSGLPGAGDLFIRHLGVARSDVNVVGITASGGRVYLTSNGGASWTQAAAPPNNGFSLSSIWFDITDPDIVYVASVAPDATRTHLWKSTNFGASWTAIDGGAFPAGVPVHMVKNDPLDPAVLYAGTHLGVYRSGDGGATWARYGAGMPLVEVTDLYVSADGSLVRASTFGRGFWELGP